MEMKAKSDKKKEVAWNTDMLFDELNNIESDGKKDVKKIVDAFCRVKAIKDIKIDAIAGLFHKCVDIATDDYWKVMFEIYVRFYNKLNSKVSKSVIEQIRSEVKVRLKEDYNVTDIRQSIIDIKDKKDNTGLCILLGRAEADSGRDSLDERLALLYVAISIIVYEEYPSSYQILMLSVQRCMYRMFAQGDKNDPTYLKSVKKALLEGNFRDDFCRKTYLYEGYDAEIERLNHDVSYKIAVIHQLREETEKLHCIIASLEMDIRNANAVIAEKVTESEQLQKDLSSLEDRNEYNMNLYEQQYKTLKTSFISKIRKDLNLEIEDLQDISDSLSEVQAKKIQRVIDNMTRILQKAGD